MRSKCYTQKYYKRLKILIGTRYPELDPNRLNYTVHLDERPGFEANVRINVSWERPQGMLGDKKVIITYCNNPMCPVLILFTVPEVASTVYQWVDVL